MTYTHEQLAARAVGTGFDGETDAHKLSRLIALLSIKRPSGGEGEMAVAKAILTKYPDSDFYTDAKGDPLAITVKVGDSRTLLSCHLDTVHGRARATTIRPMRDDTYSDPTNKVRHDPATNMLHADGDVLGADDGAGIWLLMEMIDANVAATFIFHFSEEVGGVGSSGMATHYGDFLQQFDRVVAFDRKGVHSIITHQSYTRGCSDEFADALADALSCDTYFFAKDDTGVFTDSANYTDHIGEATNVSVGYYSEHTRDERLDLHYLFNLRDQCIALDWDSLPTKRLPGEQERVERGQWANYWPTAPKREVTDKVDLFDLEFDDLVDLLEDDPYVGASLVWELMWGSDLDSSDESFVTRLKLGLV